MTPDAEQAVAIAILVILLALPLPSSATNYQDPLHRVYAATAVLRGAPQQGGTAWAVARDAESIHWITVAHVACGVGPWRIHSRGRSVPASVVRIDRHRDLALIETRLVDGVPLLRLSDQEPALGQPILCVGNVEGIQVARWGHVGADRPTMRYDKNAFPLLVLALPGVNGSSGAPVCDSRGDVLGVVEVGIGGDEGAPADVTLAITAERVREFLEQAR